ncbi:MAG: hypothetical protein SVK44_02635 [Nitrospirota bacterium]|nr:hypothetical protein [Nitrospirota bacterium]
MKSRRIFSFLSAAFFLGFVGLGTAYAQPYGPGGCCGWCPWHGTGYRRGVPNPGYGPSYGYTPRPPRYAKPSGAMGLNEAKGMFEEYMKSTNNPNLKLGKIKEQKDRFVAQITTKDGSLVDEIALDRYSGYMGSVYD